MFALALAVALAKPPKSPAPPPEEEPQAGKPTSVPLPTEKIDLEALFEGPPGEGVRRCRSKDPDIAVVSTSYTGGPQPYPGMVTASALWFVAGEVVLVEQHRAQTPSDPNAAVLRITDAIHGEHIAEGDQYTSTEKGVLSWSDGRPVLGQQTRLDVSWTCEWAIYPPRP
jgi:hypothetical protein